MHRGVRVLLPLAATALAAGCGSSSTTSSATATAAPATPVSVKLIHVPTGHARLTYDSAQKTLNVEIALTGLAPGSGHPAHIHDGSCEHQGGVAYPLTAITADAHGAGTSTTTVTNVKEAGIPDGAWYVNVHNGPALAPEDQFLPIACANVVNPSKASNVTIPLTSGPPPPSAPGSPDEAASGTATVALVNGHVQVSVDVTGLAPNSTHATHIHAGSCESQGPVVYGLDPLTADATGHATETKTIMPTSPLSSIPSGQWYVNVHRLADISTGQAAFDPIVCGDVGS